MPHTLIHLAALILGTLALFWGVRNPVEPPCPTVLMSVLMGYAWLFALLTIAAAAGLMFGRQLMVRRIVTIAISILLVLVVVLMAGFYFADRGAVCI